MNRATAILLALLTVGLGCVPSAEGLDTAPQPREAPLAQKDAKKDKSGPTTPPAIEGDATAKYLLTLTVTNVPDGGFFFWDFVPEGVLETREVSDNSIDIAGPAGTYTAKARGFANGKKFDLKKTFTLTGGATPPSPPGPNPPGPNPPGPNPPNPDPGPAGKVSRFVVVEDTSKPGQWRGDILGSQKVAAWYKAHALTHRLIDIGSTSDFAEDAATKWYRSEAAKKPSLPWLWLVDASGKVVKDLACPTQSDDAFMAVFGFAQTERGLGAIRQPPKKKWKAFGSEANVPIIPRAQWKEMSLETFLPPVYDQDGRGQCVASSTNTCFECCRAQAGLPYVHLSAGDLYSNINGGRDQGALLEDGMDWMQRFGCTTTQNVPYVWDGRRHADPGDRKNYRLTQVYLVTSFDQAASAVQQGFFLEEALTWYNNYMTPGSDGWLRGPGGGVAGGHALCGYGLARKSDGTWGIRTRNSWGASWGVNGNCVIPERNFDDIEINGFFAVRSVVQTPSPFPAPAALLPQRGEFALAP